ncbi:hypothetical protein LCGC14_0999580 [marine sediment metagenome]|uniref:DNA ligase (NAD(+)) n=1 Tax=marine sediment metagenome TaxID=412755 RepID=A0A0F9N856_9ZZZZ
MDLKDIAINHDNYSIVEVISALQKADDLYHNGEESPITDAQYDGLRRYAQRLDPTNKYFTGIGSSVRGGKIPLPFTMGSLDQLYEGDVAKWVNQNDLRDELIVITDKLDGISCMLIYDENGLRIAYSRGDGEMGADITRHLRHMPIPEQFMHIMDHPTYTIRAEIILSVEKFKRLQTTVKSRSGKPYKNPRNMVAGLMNSKKIDPELLTQLSVIAYEIVSPHHFSKKEQLSRLWKAGFSVAPHVAVKGRQAAKEEWLTEHLNTQRNDSTYEIDGVVIDVNSAIKRQAMNPTRDTLNPTFARKYKVADASNVAIVEVVEVQWNVSKHGYMKPRVRVKPVELVGVTVQHATGFNAKFIKENGIGPGAKIKITRSGDVIPFIMEVVESTTPQLPDGDWKWNETGVDVVLTNHEANADVQFEKILAFFNSIEAPYMREGSTRKFYDAGYDSIEAIIKMNEREMAGIVGTNGHKIYKGLKEQLTNIPLWKLMGSTPFFGRGVGRRKFKKLYKALGVGGLWELVSTCSVDQIVPVEGFEKKTAEKIANGMQNFWEFYNDVYDYVTILDEEEETMSSSGAMNDQKVVFTGFRDKDLAEAVENAGGTIQSGVSGKTTILVTKNPDSTSGKVKKAREKGIRIVGIDEFKGMI